jgi:hypothetical protein
MPILLTVNNIPFEYPIAGDSPGWGQAASDWAAEVTLVLNDLLGPNDIIETTFNVANNVTSSSNVNGLVFNTGQVRAATVAYSIYRISTSNMYGFTESGTMNVSYDNLAPGGSKWSLVIGNVTGNSGVTFTITDAGQIQYQSTDLGSAGYSGVMHFKAATLEQ